LSDPIISVSGLRGVVGESLTPEVAVRYAAAFAAEAPDGPIIVTRDGRTSGPMIAALLTGALKAAGREVINAGIAATPTTGVLVRELHAAGGLQISASHNPPEYNGIKLFSAEGRVMPAAAGERVLARYKQGGGPWASYDRLGTAHVAADTVSNHLALVLATVDVDRIRHAHFHVVLDVNHGAGGVVGRQLLAELGCETTVLGGEPDGRFAHPPEPTAENLATVLAHVPREHADIGFCQDPDADRLAIIDERGQYLGEEYTLALAVEHLLASAPNNGRTGTRKAIVTNCSTSRMCEDLAQRHGAPFFRSAVGEANVVDSMLNHDALLGGEGNGGVIHPDVVLVRDSMVGMALVLDLMAARERPVSALAAELPRYEIVKTKISLAPERVATGLAALERHFADAKCDRLDGLRLDWPDKWLLVRASNTEPIVRAIAEAKSQAEARRLCQVAQEVLRAL
jgi:phosphomannomutase